MNFLAHARVARAGDADDLVVLGAVLPDIESLVGQRLGPGRDDPRLVRGITLHRATDAVFHADPRFVSESIALTRALRREGVDRGPSRAVGHAGWELLLDGLLVDDRHTTEALDRAGEALARLLSSDDRRLQGFVDWQRSQEGWAGYDDPVDVARRLHRQLLRRPRLSFPAEQLEQVAQCLAEARQRIAEIGMALIEDVTGSVIGRRHQPGSQVGPPTPR